YPIRGSDFSINLVVVKKKAAVPGLGCCLEGIETGTVLPRVYIELTNGGHNTQGGRLGITTRPANTNLAKSGNIFCMQVISFLYQVPV
ncbi:MAG TPA: hypothetical protein VJ951_06145, partial [Bacteroidales bacterium]|nr:hypothetical protein [Bacteroidales bacterium]